MHFPALRLKSAHLALFSLILVAIWYGFQEWLAQAAVRDSSPLAFNAARFTVGFIVMLPICVHRGRWPTHQEWQGGLQLGAIASAAFAAESFALKYDPAGRASFLGGLYVIALPLGAWWIAKKRQAWLTVWGCIVVLFGAFLLWYAPGGSLSGDLFSVLRAAIFVALLTITRQLGATDFQFVMLIEFAVISLVSFSGAAVLHQTTFPFSWDTWGPALACGIGGSAICAAVDLWAYPQLSVALVGVLVFSEAPTTALWGLVFGKQSASPVGIAGFALITVGTMAVIVGDLGAASFQRLWHAVFASPRNSDVRLNPPSLDSDHDLSLPDPSESY